MVVEARWACRPATWPGDRGGAWRISPSTCSRTVRATCARSPGRSCRSAPPPSCTRSARPRRPREEVAETASASPASATVLLSVGRFGTTPRLC